MYQKGLNLTLNKKNCLIICCFLLLITCSFSLFSREPVIFNKSVHKNKETIIVIDAGHGGKDEGTASRKDNYEEKSLTLATSILVQSQLRKLGYKTILTRQTDIFVPLLRRSELANSHQAKVFVSIHYNYSQNHSALGTEIYYYADKKGSKRTNLSRILGEELLTHLETEANVISRGVKTGNFSVIRETKMPAILLEVGFLSNPKERERLLDPRYRMKIAKGVALGIHSYLRKVKQIE